MAHVTVVVGGQFGSEAKGATVAHLAQSCDYRDTVVRVAGPNAGHTAYDSEGREWKLRSVPVAAVVNNHVKLHIAAGSEIDPSVLADEVTALEDAGIPIMHRLTIDPSATLLTKQNIATESATGIVGRIGSTGKGIGAARASRIMREAPTAKDLYAGRDSVKLAALDLRDRRQVIIEGTQGYGLGLHTENYPQVTSSDCRAIDFLAMAGISPWSPDVNNDVRVVVVARCFPIRVAGNSGPLKGETTWADLGLPDEHTTVTHKVRRVGEWDEELVKAAIEANGGGDWSGTVSLAITMVDQKFPATRDAKTQIELAQASEEAYEWLGDLEERLETPVVYVGTGPKTMFAVSL